MGQTKTKELRWFRAAESEVGVAKISQPGSCWAGERFAVPWEEGRPPPPPPARGDPKPAALYISCPGSGLAPTGTSYAVGALRPYSWLLVRYSGCGSGCLRGHKASSRAQGRGVGGPEGDL